MQNLRDKVRGNFLGVGIGDALGKPVETLSASVISEKFGRITDYITNSSHKWFAEDDAGTTTDDWQLTKAVAKAMIKSGKFDLDEIAKEHVVEFLISVRGWGNSTRESVGKIAQGVHWNEASQTDKIGRGTGNGVCMKVSPAGLYMALTNSASTAPPWNDHIYNIVNMSIMTHRTSLAVTSGLSHAFATWNCFLNTPDSFNESSFLKILLSSAALGRQFLPETIQDDLKTRYERINAKLQTEEIINEFGSGSCYVYDSLPFTYSFFLRNPYTIESLYDCISAGGDTDSNGSMLAGLLGSLHGTKIFPDHLVNGLKIKDEAFAIADEFYETFK